MEIVVSPPPALPIERGLAEPGPLADTIVRRWQDHLRLYRLEQVSGTPRAVPWPMRG